ncbi:TetR/AcrR family transcriptional regulator [Streptomyces flavofungini]|uniref:TetR/AcrR family transcriptional regulator n=1 Tax=Streptomyces flavofungini TaxID=68200 RepID=UPI0034E02E74
MTTTVRRTQQQRREEAEAALLAAAADLIGEEGVHSLTLARVGDRAGYSRGLVSHHFGSKGALVERLARSAQSGFVPGLEGLPPGLDRLLRLIDGYVNELGRMDASARAFLLLWAEAATTPALAAIFQERSQAFRAELCEDLVAGMREGAIRPDVVPDVTAIALLSQLRGIGMQLLSDPGQADIHQLRTQVTEVWRRALTREAGT